MYFFFSFLKCVDGEDYIVFVHGPFRRRHVFVVVYVTEQLFQRKMIRTKVGG